MITRGLGFPRNHGIHPAYRDNRAGLTRTVMVNGVPNTWAIARPGGMYQPNGAPHFLDVPDKNRGLANQAIQKGAVGLALPQYRLEADLSNPDTWQRGYRFT